MVGFVLVSQEDPFAIDRAKRLAREIHWPLVKDLGDVPEEALVAWVDEGPLRLQRLYSPQSGSRQAGAVYVDFSAPRLEHRRRLGVGRNQLFTKALGVHKINWREREALGQGPLRILDATAGLGQDAWIMAWIHPQIKVTAVERSPLLFAMLEDGVKRSQELVNQVNLEFIYGDSVKYLESLPRGTDQRAFDVILLDPMFPKSDKSALSRKEMQVFQDLLLQDPESFDIQTQELLTKACEQAPRVVVKRPRKSPLIKSSLAYSLEGRSIRYDVYLNR